MSHLLGLCCCNACENCRDSLRARLPSCLGGEDSPGEQVEHGQEGESSSASEVVTRGPSSAEAGVGTEAESTVEASAAMPPPQVSRPGHGSHPVGTMYLSHVGSDLSLSSDPQTEPSTLASTAILKTAKDAEEDTSPEDVSGMEMKPMGAGADQEQSSSASELEEQAEKA
ncbi:uncharacterized protein LOC142563961 [Dermacentor variabilis]|uniref:uncharacterized protein LOC142563961 n=1 Tax=Dermacentor variabilis TaxID=34621 RepID=UPI003F5B6873